MLRRRVAAVCLTALTVLTACSGDDDTTIGSPDPTTEGSNPVDVVPDMVADAPIPAARCEANKAAGVITYLSSFDFAASASIVDVLTASNHGYYDAMCLDVVIKPSFSVDNYPLIAANEAQIAHMWLARGLKRRLGEEIVPARMALIAYALDTHIAQT